MLGFCFTVLSAKSSPLAVERRIEEFLTTWRNKLVHAQDFGMFVPAGHRARALLLACIDKSRSVLVAIASYT